MPTRLKAFLVHLLGSIMVLSVLLYLIIFHWYPSPFFSADGGWEGIRLIAGIDIILGPLLTFLIYNPAKGMKKLKFDMTMILAVQIFALSAGAHIVYDQRTRLVVFAKDHFESLSGDQVEEAKINQDMWEKLSKDQHPAMAYVVLPKDKKERVKFIWATLSQGIPLSKRSDHYDSLTPEHRREMMKQGYDLLEHVKQLPEFKSKLDAFLRKHGGKAEDYAYLRLVARYDEATLVMRKKDGEIVGSLPINYNHFLDAVAKLEISRPKSVKTSSARHPAT